MRILVTGATGLVGNNCVRALGQEHDVHVLVRDRCDTRPLAGLPVTFHSGDLSRPDSLSQVIPEVDAIIHSAGDTHIGKQPRPSQHVVNTLATKAIAEISHERNMRLVFVSSVDALPAAERNGVVDEDSIGGPKCPIGYVLSKRAAEAELLELMEQGLDAVIVNPGFMLGPWDWKPSSGRMLLEVANRFTPFGPSGGFSICDVRDVARAICRIATGATKHTRYILAGHNMTYVAAWTVFADVSGGRAPLAAAGPAALFLTGMWGDWVAKITGREGDVNSGAIRMSQLFHYYDSSRACGELAYDIRPLAETVSDAWAWFQQHGFVDKTD